MSSEFEQQQERVVVGRQGDLTVIDYDLLEPGNRLRSTHATAAISPEGTLVGFHQDTIVTENDSSRTIFVRDWKPKEGIANPDTFSLTYQKTSDGGRKTLFTTTFMPVEGGYHCRLHQDSRTDETDRMISEKGMTVHQLGPNEFLNVHANSGTVVVIYYDGVTTDERWTLSTGGKFVNGRIEQAFRNYETRTGSTPDDLACTIRRQLAKLS